MNPPLKTPSPLLTPGPLRATPGPRPLHGRQARLAEAFDEEIYPVFGQRFGDMLLKGTAIAPGASVLEVGCATGAVTAEIVRRLAGGGHVVALEATPALLALARERLGAEHVGRRVFFRGHAPGTPLGFSDASFDLVLVNLAQHEAADLAALVADAVRVAKPGASVVLTAPLRGTWAEFLDLYREALVRERRADSLEALDAYVQRLPEPDLLERLCEAAGLADVETDAQRWEIVFRSAREFFYSPVIELGPLPRWQEIAGRGDDMQSALIAANRTIDTYYAGRPFSVGVIGGRFAGRKAGPRT